MLIRAEQYQFCRVGTQRQVFLFKSLAMMQAIESENSTRLAARIGFIAVAAPTELFGVELGSAGSGDSFTPLLLSESSFFLDATRKTRANLCGDSSIHLEVSLYVFDA